jgi:choline/carnitine/betaine transport
MRMTPSKQLITKIFDPVRVGIALALLIAFILWGRLAGQSLTEVMEGSFSVLTHDLGWLYQLFGFACIVVSLWLVFGPYSRIKLGPDDSKPEFSTFAWYSFIFACGNGVGIVYWAAAEPLSFLVSPPLNLPAMSPEAMEASLAWTLFHWGWTPWAFYLALTVPMGYFAYRRNRPLRYSSALPEKLRLMSNGLLGKMVDGILMFALTMGIVTSLGLGIKQLVAGLNLCYGIADGAITMIIVGVFWTIAISATNCLGLRKGISSLSNFNIFLAVAILFFVFFTGPSSFILNMGTNAFGFILDRFAYMSLWTDPVAGGGFPQRWTSFYWAWWLAWAPILCIFVARVSKGRTIREIVTMHMVVAVASSWLWFIVLGSTTLDMAVNIDPSLVESIKAGDTSSIIFRVFGRLPFSSVTAVAFIMLLFVFLTTTADSAAFICSQMSYTGRQLKENPPMSSRVFWSLVMSGIALYLVIYSEGISALQIASLLPSLLVIIFYFLVYVAFIKDLKQNEI